MRNRYRGRHTAPRRHLLAPLLTTGLVASASALVVALPATAAPFELTSGASIATAAGDLGAASAPRLSPPSVTPYRVLPATRLVARPPSFRLPVAGYHLTGRFGQVSGLWSTVHTGLDFAAPEGTPIHSIATGTVGSAASDGSYGNKTVVRLADGTELWFCHQSRFAVRPGQRLRAGDLLGYVGSTGNTTGPHLHLEVHPHGGGPVDPRAWLVGHGLRP